MTSVARFHRCYGFYALSILAISAFGFRSHHAVEPLVLKVGESRVFQRIANFGASGAWSLDPIGTEWSEENKNRIADLLFSRDRGIGLSLWRFNVGAGSIRTDPLWDRWRGAECFRDSESAPYDWNRQAGQQWFLKAARQRGVDQFDAFANSPPVWMTANGHAYCDKNGPSTNLKPGHEPDYARFMADVLQHFAREGLGFRYVSPVNEPQWAWDGGQEGCRYNNDDLRRVLQALHDEIAARHLKTDILAPESGDYPSLLDSSSHSQQNTRPADSAADPRSLHGEFARNFLGDPAMRSALGNRISAHAYWADRGERNLVQLRRGVRETIDRYAPGAELWQTEYCVMEHKRDLGMDTALRVATVIHHDLAVLNASAWHWWLAVSPADYKDGLIYTDYRSTGQQNVLPSKTLWALGNFSRYVRPGARRIALEPADTGGVLASAYRNPDGGLAIVVINPTDSARTLSLQLPPRFRSVVPRVTSESADLATQNALSSRDPVTIAPRSIVTLTTR